MDRRLKRVFVIVLDSMGMGAMADAARFGDEGADTLGHISQTVEHFYIPNLASLGLANLKSLKQVQPQEHPLGYYAALNEKSNGKDTMTGHWEMMGIETKKPFITFTEHGFPPELIAELEKKMRQKNYRKPGGKRNKDFRGTRRAGNQGRKADRVHIGRFGSADLRERGDDGIRDPVSLL